MEDGAEERIGRTQEFWKVSSNVLLSYSSLV